MQEMLKDPAIVRPEHILPNLGLQEDGRYQLSEDQAQAILDLQLHRLTGLERIKLSLSINKY